MQSGKIVVEHLYKVFGSNPQEAIDLLKEGWSKEKILAEKGAVIGVSDVSFSVEEGEIVGLLGRNGAGKTTSFRMTMGMIEPDAGQVVFNGQDVSTLAMYQRAQRGMGYLAQEPSIFQRLTVQQNLHAILETRRMSRRQRRERAEQLMAQFDLTKIRKNKASLCSGGEKRVPRQRKGQGMPSLLKIRHRASALRLLQRGLLRRER